MQGGFIMPSSRPRIVDYLLEMWSRLIWRQRLSILAVGFLCLILIGSVVYFMNQVEYKTLYWNLNPKDAQAVADMLIEKKRDFLVQGTSILVAAPNKEVDKLRIEIAASGLEGSSRFGYEIFDKDQFVTTDFTKQVNFQRALESELARAISSSQELSSARVHIMLPKDSLRDEKREEAKARVVIALKKGAELSESGIAGIKNLVAGAVPRLRLNNVSIVDGEGRILSQ
jgi:flagellar M-ring protein FliF